MAESSWQKSMWFCLIMINVFTYFMILHAICFLRLLQDDLAIAIHKPESLVLCHLIKMSSEFLTSRGIWPVEGCDLTLNSIFSKDTSTRMQDSHPLVLALQRLELSSLVLFYDWHASLVLSPLFSWKSILRKITHFCSGIHVDGDVCLGRGLRTLLPKFIQSKDRRPTLGIFGHELLLIIWKKKLPIVSAPKSL